MKAILLCLSFATAATAMISEKQIALHISRLKNQLNKLERAQEFELRSDKRRRGSYISYSDREKEELRAQLEGLQAMQNNVGGQ